MQIISLILTATAIFTATVGNAEATNSYPPYTIEVKKVGNKLGVVKVTKHDIAHFAGTLHETWYRGLGPVEFSTEMWASIFANAKPTSLCKDFVELSQISKMNESIDVAPAFVDFVNRQLQGARRAIQTNQIECNW